MEILTYFSSHSRHVSVATWFLMLPIDKENSYRLSRGRYIYIYIYTHIYIYMIYIYKYVCMCVCVCVEFLASHFCDLSRCISKFTGWVIIEELSIRRRLRIFLISLGQKTRVKHCYVDLSSWYNSWFPIICISININSDLSTTIRDGFDALPVNGSTRDIFL